MTKGRKYMYLTTHPSGTLLSCVFVFSFYVFVFFLLGNETRARGGGACLMIMETKKTTGGWLGRGCNAIEVEVDGGD